MSKKSKIKLAVKNSFQQYYDKGLYTTAARVRSEIWEAIDKAFKQK